LGKLFFDILQKKKILLYILMAERVLKNPVSGIGPSPKKNGLKVN